MASIGRARQDPLAVSREPTGMEHLGERKEVITATSPPPPDGKAASLQCRGLVVHERSPVSFPSFRRTDPRQVVIADNPFLHADRLEDAILRERVGAVRGRAINRRHIGAPWYSHARPVGTRAALIRVSIPSSGSGGYCGLGGPLPSPIAEFVEHRFWPSV